MIFYSPIIAQNAAANAARLGIEKIGGELEQARQAYAQEVSIQCDISEMKVSGKVVTIPHLELHYTSFRIIEVLSRYNPHCLDSDSEVGKSIRWVWRSRGRHERLQHEDCLPPRYISESSTLAKLLVTQSRTNPADTDLLFEMIRIYLQPLVSDFSFLQRHLIDITVKACTLDQQQSILKRFATLVGSDGTDEGIGVAVVSSQMLISPMLRNVRTKELFQGKPMTKLLAAILKDSAGRSSNLTSELMIVLDIILEKMDKKDLASVEKDLLKYIQNTAKHAEGSAKFQAIVAMSRLATVFRLPTKVVVSTYQHLIKSKQERYLVRGAVGILIPVIESQLEPLEMEGLRKYTLKLVRDETLNGPQQVNLWEAITRHPHFFKACKDTILMRVPDQISIFGIQHGVSTDLRLLAVSIARLVVAWDVASDPSNAKTNELVANKLFEIASVNGDGKMDEQRRDLQDQVMSLLGNISSTNKMLKIDKMTIRLNKNSVDPASHLNHLKLCADVILRVLENAPENEFANENICVLLREVESVPSSFTCVELTDQLKIICSKALEATHKGSLEVKSQLVAILSNLMASGNVDAACLSIAIVDKSKSRLVESFAGSFASLSLRLADRHVDEIAQSLSIGSNMVDNQFYATPTLGEYEIACGLGFVPAKSGWESRQDDGCSERQIELQNQTPDAVTRTLMTCLHLLGSCRSEMHSFASCRGQLLDSFNLILDHSDSLPLILSVVSIVGRWILVDPQQSPLTKSEKEDFLHKFAILIDQSRLLTIQSHVLGDLMCSFVLVALGCDFDLVREYPFGLGGRAVSSTESRKDILGLSSFQKIYASCLLSSDRLARTLVAGSCCLDGDGNQVYQQLSTIALQNGGRGGDLVDVGGLPKRSLSIVLGQLFDLDYTCLGHRLWTAAIVDQLLYSTRHTGGVSFECARMSNQAKISPPQGLMRVEMRNKSECMISVELDNSGQCGQVYASFATGLSSERKGSGGHGRCVAAIRNLLHADVSTCQAILENCFQSAWACLSDNDVRCKLIDSFQVSVPSLFLF